MNLSEFTPATNDDAREYETMARSYLLKPDMPTPYAAYLVLKDKFGPSNSSNFDESKSQWAYLLKSRDGFVHVYDWKLWAWSIAVHSFDSNEATGRKIAEAVSKQIQHSAERLKSRMKAASDNAQAFIIETPIS
jgi:hypothetical protein